jgi:hypothetical protein
MDEPMTAVRAFKIVASYFARLRRRAVIARLMKLRDAARVWH